VIEQQGRVDRVDGGMAWVQVGGRSGCEACDAGQGCGAGVFVRLLDSREARIRVENTLAAVPGDPVLLGLSEQSYLALVLRLYGLPLVAGLLAGVLAFGVASRLADLSGAALDLTVGLAALVAGWVALRQVRLGLAASFTRFSPRMLESGTRLDCGASGRIP
jgi:sigma-E factor negative regulatory protein RseC